MKTADIIIGQRYQVRLYNTIAQRSFGDEAVVLATRMPVRVYPSNQYEPSYIKHDGILVRYTGRGERSMMSAGELRVVRPQHVAYATRPTARRSAAPTPAKQVVRNGRLYDQLFCAKIYDYPSGVRSFGNCRKAWRSAGFEHPDKQIVQAWVDATYSRNWDVTKIVEVLRPVKKVVSQRVLTGASA